MISLSVRINIVEAGLHNFINLRGLEIRQTAGIIIKNKTVLVTADSCSLTADDTAAE